MNEKYNAIEVEKKWQEKWEKDGLYKTSEDDTKKKFYCLDMFPYPSGSGLHVGHWRGYVLSDIIARYHMLKGENVLHPMGWDAFGLPAENAAIKNKKHPREFTGEAIENFRRQIKQIGTMIDWSREINTSSPEYYKWTQWLFIKLFENGLAYKKKAPVNWCPSCQTVLANEQVVSGECERCGTKVTTKDLSQWFFKITDFAEDLLTDLEKLDWPERTKLMQKNWIGRSDGAMVKFQIKDSDDIIEVFTTRPDTLYGATYMAIAPEHEIVESKKYKVEHKKEIEEYVKRSKEKTDIERETADKEKTGVFTGLYTINPVNNKEIPIWISDYVLMGYGTGAIMSVPAHDQRDFDFAKKYDIPIVQVISEDGKETKLDKAYEDDGLLINSEQYNNLTIKEAQNKIVEDLSQNKIAAKEINYRLRDWLISRQRYWGSPIPIVNCPTCGEVAVPESDLPVLLPEDIEFKPHGDSPLKQSENFTNTTCPKCGGKATRETDTMDTFVCSSWYYLRYTDPNNTDMISSSEKTKHWMPVDTYVGGIEHAILHLLYARFISKALTKLGIIDFGNAGEPFQKLFNIGMIYLNGAKMSKSKGNIVSPDEMIEKYGTDALRGYELFIGPAEQDAEWQVQGISGVKRFIDKVWEILDQDKQSLYSDENSQDGQDNIEIDKAINIITQEIEDIKPNTAISHLMELFNALRGKKLSNNDKQRLTILLSPFFPHLAEEIWEKLGNKESIFKEKWPIVTGEIKETENDIVVQVNGKVKSIIKMPVDLTENEAVKLAKSDLKIEALLANHKILKTIYVAGRILNFVIE